MSSFSESDVSVLDGTSDATTSNYDLFLVYVGQTKEILINFVSFLTNRVALHIEQVVRNLVQDVAELYLSDAAVLVKIVADHDEANESSNIPLPPAVVHRVIRYRILSSATSLSPKRSAMTAAG